MHFENLNARDGLSNDWVRAGGNILQDTVGFLWVGTQNGLNRYDGSNFKIYRHDPDDDSSLSDNNIWTLYLDRSDRLWIAGNTGVDRYDPLQDRFVRYELIKEDNAPSDLLFPSAILEDTHGNFLLGAEGGLYQLGQQTQFTNTRLISSGWVTSLLEDKDGRLWVGARTSDFGIYVFQWQPDQGWVPDRQFNHTENDEGLQNDQILKIFEDHHGDIWIATIGGLDRYNREHHTFSHFLSGKRINDIEEDKDGILWISTNESGLYRFDPEREQTPSQVTIPFQRLTEIYINPTNEIWLGSVSTGLYHYSKYFPTFSTYQKNPDLFFGLQTKHTKDQIRTVGAYFMEREGGRVWLASKQALYRFEEAQYSFSRLQSSDQIQSRIVSVQERVDGSVWIQALQGLYLFTPNNEQVRGYLENQPFRYFIEDKQGDLWLDDPKGREIIHLQSNSNKIFRSYQVCQHSPTAKGTERHITFIQQDSRQNIWVGTIHGLYRYDREKDTMLSCDLPTASGNASGKNYFFGAFEDHRARWWTYTGEAVYRYLPEEKHFVRYAGKQEGRKGLSSYTKISFFEDSQGGVWVRSIGGGLNKYDETSDAFVSFVHQTDNPNSLSHNDILDLFEDTQQRLWIATKRGLNRWEPQSKTFIRFTTDNGLIANEVGSILEDQDSMLWLGTGGGLSRFDPKDNTFSNYTYRDGLPMDYLFWNIHYISKNGTIFFLQRPTSLQSFFVFHPQQLLSSPHPPELAFTGFRLFQKPVPIRGTTGDSLEWESPLVASITHTQKIELKHWQNDFSIEFAALSFLQPEKHKFSYILEGYQNHWTGAIAGDRRVNYTNISPGAYTFRVKAANKDGVWNEEGIKLELIVRPPWYWAWWSKSLYFFLIIGLLWWGYQFQLNRQLALNEVKRLREIDKVKTQLYTNFTHEFRTPLTVILGMAEEIRSVPRKHLLEGLDMIKRNGKNLLQLVNQMLDLRKLQNGKMPLDLVQGDILSYLRYVIEPFYFYAESKELQLTVSGVEHKLVMDYDPEKIREIISNLLSNAIKFTPPGGAIDLTLKTIHTNTPEGSTDPQQLVIIVSDTGIGIPPEELAHIFDHFYQVEGTHRRRGGGTGIGLTLTKELIKILGGTISVSSKVKKGTEFCVHLPISRKVLHAIQAPKGNEWAKYPDLSAMPLGVDGTSDKELKPYPLILIVEDHQDIAVYLQGCLQKEFNLAFASDGEQGLQMALELIPDLIISDIMMPQKDGYALTYDLKNHHLTNHIPIILLTAKADRDSRIQGLDSGADAYLTKPFYREELLMRIRKLIELRRQLQLHYQNFGFVKAGKGHPNNRDFDFLQQINATLDAHLSDQNFEIAHLCRAIGISRTQLHRKLKAITARPTSQYIRSYRLFKARELLLSTDLNVTEVSMEVGFKHLSHFTAAFKREFGINPSEI